MLGLFHNCILVTVFERLVFKSMKADFGRNFGVHQYGFRSRSSTVCVLISLHDHDTQLLDSVAVNGVQILAFNFTKACDELSHSRIIL